MKRLLTMPIFAMTCCCFLRAENVGSAEGQPVHLQTSPKLQLRSANGEGLRFTLKQAENYALANHPQIAAANLTADAVRQEIREARSEFFPQVDFDSDSVYEPNVRTRLGADDGVNTPSLFKHQADGFTFSQLITDFGRTYELTESAHFRAGAAQDRVNIARAVVLLAVDRSYFDLLRANAVLRVANETVDTRNIAFKQVNALARTGLKSTLDVNFAQVTLSQAQLLQIQAESDVSQAEAELSTALGFSDAQHFILTEVPVDLNMPPVAGPLVQEALQRRPELANLRDELDASQRFAKAQAAQQYPTVSVVGAAGIVPAYPSGQHFKPEYVAVGANVELPVFNGGKLDAESQQAKFLADAAAKNLVDAQDTITRDVRIAWLDARTAKDRIAVSDQMAKAASDAQNLANSRYRLGTSSIVEFTQAQLNYTEAELQVASAKYDYQSGLALLKFTIGDSFSGAYQLPK